MTINLRHIFFLICFVLTIVSVIVPTICTAEEWEDDEDEDLEYFFSTRQKSTIDDFPLKEIGGEELSDAAIAGALQANSSSGLSAKPVYEQEKEETDKKKSGDALKKDERLKLANDLPINQFPISAPDLRLPVYQQPTGRTYSDHMTHTVERP